MLDRPVEDWIDEAVAFAPPDDASAEPVIIVNESFAARWSPNDEAMAAMGSAARCRKLSVEKILDSFDPLRERWCDLLCVGLVVDVIDA